MTERQKDRKTERQDHRIVSKTSLYVSNHKLMNFLQMVNQWVTCAILQMLSHLKSGKQRNGYRSIHTSVKSLKSWNSNAFIFSAQKSRQNLNELNCVRILARTAKLNAASNSRKTIDVIVFRVLPVYYLLRQFLSYHLCILSHFSFIYECTMYNSYIVKYSYNNLKYLKV